MQQGGIGRRNIKKNSVHKKMQCLKIDLKPQEK